MASSRADQHERKTAGEDSGEKDPYYELVGQVFQQLRNNRPLKGKGFSQKTIKKIEEGRVDVNLRGHKTLAGLLNTTLDDVHRLARELDDQRPTPASVAAPLPAVDLALVEVARAQAERLLQTLALLIHQPKKPTSS